jgi:hypothetical protein
MPATAGRAIAQVAVALVTVSMLAGARSPLLAQPVSVPATAINRAGEPIMLQWEIVHRFFAMRPVEPAECKEDNNKEYPKDASWCIISAKEKIIENEKFFIDKVECYRKYYSLLNEGAELSVREYLDDDACFPLYGYPPFYPDYARGKNYWHYEYGTKYIERWNDVIDDRTAWDPNIAVYDPQLTTPEMTYVHVQLTGAAPASGCRWWHEGKEDTRIKDMKCKGVIFKLPYAKTKVWLEPIKRELADWGHASIVVEPRHTLVVVLGDSYAAGEGLPLADWRGENQKAIWWDRRCHRSLYAGPVLAVAKLAQFYQHRTFSLLNFACSGATIQEGMVGPYAGIELDPENTMPLPPQIQAATTALCKNAPRQPRACDPAHLLRPDFLLLSIGGNDVGFGSLAADLLAHKCGKDPCRKEWSKATKQKLDRLRTDYDNMSNKIKEQINPKHIVLIGYMNPVVSNRQ